MGKPSLALHYIKRALYLGRLLCGPNHPDNATTFTNIAMMLQDLHKHKQAIDYLLQALKSHESILGPTHLSTAAIYHMIAIAYSQLDQFKEALSFEKKNYTILHAKVGDSDIRAIESNIWLRQFTQKAVAMQMETQKAQRDVNEQLKNIKNVTLGKSVPVQTIISTPKPTTPSVPPAPLPNIGNRPVQELLAYINDKPVPGSSFSQRNQKKFHVEVAPAPTVDSLQKSKKKKTTKSKKEEEKA